MHETLVKLTHQKNTKVRDAANILGIGTIPAARLIRAFNGYQQAKKDEEYGQFIKPTHFAYFAEVIFKEPVLQRYLAWDEKSKRFKNETNLKKFLSWIFPEEGKDPRVTRAMQIRDILAPVMISHPELFERWENDENMSIDIVQICPKNHYFSLSFGQNRTNCIKFMSPRDFCVPETSDLLSDKYPGSVSWQYLVKYIAAYEKNVRFVF